MHNRRIITFFFFLLIFASGVILLNKNWIWIEKNILNLQAPSSSAPSPAPEDFRGTTLQRTPCLDWSNKALTVIPIGEELKVYGRNLDSTWYYVRWLEFPTECWVQRSQVNPINFKTAELSIIPEPFPSTELVPPTAPVATQVSDTPRAATLTLRESASPVPSASTVLGIDPIVTRQPSDTPAPSRPTNSPTITLTPTLTLTPTRTYTSTNTFTPSKTLTPTHTFTPSYTPTASDTPISTVTATSPCEPPDAPVLNSLRRIRGTDLTWTSIPDVIAYEVYKSVNEEDFNLLISTIGTSLPVTPPQSSAHYYYVVAVTDCGSSPHSNTVSISR